MPRLAFVRNIDGLGRFNLPAELRKTMDLEEGDALEIIVNETPGTITLRKYEPGCIFCHGVYADMTEFSGKLICQGCKSLMDV